MLTSTAIIKKAIEGDSAQDLKIGKTSRDFNEGKLIIRTYSKLNKAKFHTYPTAISVLC